MLQYPQIDPVAFHVFSWPVYWYGLMYLVGFMGGWLVLALRLRSSDRGFTQDQLADIIFYAAIGAIVGGRLGYAIFYGGSEFIHHPLLVFQTWKGGMSFHGGLLGVLIGMTLCAYKFDKKFLALTDFIAPAVPVGLAAGRLGNFINGELWGKVTDVPWAMVFPTGGPVPRHPSQLYELSLEGIVLFIVLWSFSLRPKPLGAVSGMFAMLYAIFRFCVEFYRVPDPQLGYLAFDWLTQGQLLSIPLFFVGVFLLVWAYRKKGQTV